MTAERDFPPHVVIGSFCNKESCLALVDLSSQTYQACRSGQRLRVRARSLVASLGGESEESMRFLHGGRVPFVALLAVAFAAVAALPAGARAPGTNGQITFARSNPTLGDSQGYVVNPGGDDVPGSWSANGRRIVFQRFGPDSYEGVFVVNVNGTGLRRILPPTVSANCCTFNWSPQGNEIAFSRHVTPDVHSSLWVMHSDGSGLRPLTVPPSSSCGGPNADPAAIGCLEPAWSPDGTKIAFAGGLDLDTDGEIYVVNVDGTGLTQVTHTGGSQSPDWGTHPVTG